MQQYAFIFARGGSKGLPGKNVKYLSGKPLIAWSIIIAQNVSSVDEVFVSTDDNEIARVANEYGATVINRPAELASDTSPEWLSWRHAIEWVQKERGEFDIFISLPATSPLRIVDDVNRALKTFVERDADLCIGITPANRSPYFNMVVQDSQKQLRLAIKPVGQVTRRQDAPAVYDITTVVYISKPDFILKSNGIFDGKVVGVEIPKERAVDIDDETDFLLAEVIMERRTHSEEE
ncbi:acylneuraminate cytidylyltransferase family protein [Erwinia sp. P6884]|uniref:acylneuraminate cytidylyltransferase family protein n=1 Tax=Erwinia sp. P6884 TaxID=3141450 RepID=UPI0031997B6C